MRKKERERARKIVCINHKKKKKKKWEERTVHVELWERKKPGRPLTVKA